MSNPSIDQTPLPPEPVFMDSTDGVSLEDQAEIHLEIEKVVQQNKIRLEPQAFKVHPKHRGWGFPLSLNLTALFLLAGGVFVLYQVFQYDESQIQKVKVISTTGEGQVLLEFRKEMENQLLAKDQEIQQIQNRMGSIDRERSELQQNFDVRVREKEEFLKGELNRQLEEERARLRAEGLSEEVIQNRLKAFEEEKNRQFQKQLTDFITRAQEEKNALTENLARTKQEYEKTLSGLGQERRSLMEDSKRREAELQARLESQTRVEGARADAAEQQLLKAQKELETLSKVKERSLAAEAQLAGIYMNVAQSLQRREYEKARAQITELNRFLEDASLLSLPFMIPRLESDLTMAGTLSALVSAEITRIQAETANFAQTASDATSAIQALATSADERLQKGDIAGAEELYLQALGRIPQVLATHEYFLKKKLLEETTLRNQRNKALEEGDKAFEQGNHAAALTAYSRALDLIPMASVQRDAFLGRLQETGYQLLSQEKGPLPYDAPLGPLNEAEKMIGENRHGEALGLYVGYLEKYPASVQSAAAFQGIRQASAWISSATQENPRTALQLATLQKEKAELEKTLAALRLQGTKDRQSLDEKDLELSQLKEQMIALNARLMDLETLPVESGVVSTEPDPLMAQEIARLSPLAAQWETLGQNYKDFVEKESAILTKGQTTSNLLEARLYLDGFFTSDAALGAMPGIKDRVGRYEKAYQEAGQRETLVNLTDLVENLAKLESTLEKKTYLSNVQRRYKDNPTLLDFVKKLSILFP